MKPFVNPKFMWLEIASVVLICIGIFRPLFRIPQEYIIIPFCLGFILFAISYLLSNRPHPEHALHLLCKGYIKYPDAIGEQSLLRNIDTLRLIIGKLGPAVQIADTLRDYCRLCKGMLAFTEKDGAILPLQTPADPASEDAKKEYDEYISATIDRILQTDSSGSYTLTTYQRLIIVDPSPNNISKIKEKLEGFILKLFEKVIEQNNKGLNPTLNCLVIGMVKDEQAAKVFHSNIDIHITSRSNSCIAFQAPTNGEKFGASIHLNERMINPNSPDALKKKLEDGFNALWSISNRFYFKNEYNPVGIAYINDQQKKIMNKLLLMLQKELY